MEEENKTLVDMTEKKPKLEAGNKCKMARSPGDSIIGKYLGATYTLPDRKIHVFSAETDKGEEYFFLNDYWICERQEIIDYMIRSSYRYRPFTKKELEEDKTLIKILKQLGEKI